LIYDSILLVGADVMSVNVKTEKKPTLCSKVKKVEEGFLGN